MDDAELLYFNERRDEESSSESSAVEESFVSEPSVSQVCSSGIFGPPTSSRSYTKAHGAGDLKEPWVPAPGRCSRALKQKPSASCIFEPQHTMAQKQTYSSVPKAAADVKSGPSSKAGSLERKPPKSGKKKRTRAKTVDGVAGYKLESKDSLVDVTATLKAQREEVLQLWQKNLQENSSPEILVHLEKANNLALEATQEVARLQDKIRQYKTTPKKLTANGSKSLEQMRENILGKLREFEECRSRVQIVLSEAPIQAIDNGFDPTIRDKSPSIVHRSVSQTSSVVMGSRSRDPTCDYTKQSGKVPAIVTESEEYNGNEVLRENMNQFSTMNKPGSRGDFEDISYQRQVGLEHDAQVFTPRSGQKASRPILDSSYYREKIVSLQRKLMDQEFHYDEMKRKLASIETKNDFDIQLLKNNMKNQIQELSPIPEMVEIAEKRLNETLQAKFAMENEVQLKNQHLSNMKKEVDRLTKELFEEKERSSKMEKLLEKKLDSAESEIKSLRMELLNRADRINNMESKGVSHGGLEYAEEKIYVLEDKIMELNHELNMERKHRAIAEHGKDNIAAQKDHQIDQLMNELEATRQQNQKLKTQLQVVKNSYHDMFSPYLAQSGNTVGAFLSNAGGDGAGQGFTAKKSEKRSGRREK